jgi:hypothetical protein
MMRLGMMVVGVWLLAAQAQAATVIYEVPSTTPLATVQAWVPTLYVNNVAFAMTHTCTTAGPIHTCSATLPVITAALTATGSQTFQVTLKDPVFGEGTRSSPLVLVRPAVPSALRIQ